MISWIVCAVLLAIIFGVSHAIAEFENAPASQAKLDLLTEQAEEIPELQKLVHKAMEDGILSRKDCVELGYIYRRLKRDDTLRKLDLM
jgi:hypothetical protein